LSSDEGNASATEVIKLISFFIGRDSQKTRNAIIADFTDDIFAAVAKTASKCELTIKTVFTVKFSCE
jgi:acyl-CoA hydrolase